MFKGMILAIISIGLGIAGQSQAAVGSDPNLYVPGEMIVGFRPEASSATRSAAVARVAGRVKRTLGRINAVQLAFTGKTVPQAIDAILKDPSVDYAEPNFYGELLSPPNDSLFTSSWHLQNTGQSGGTPNDDIHALGGWGYISQAPDVLVAVLDTGVDYTHPDLAPNMWTNAAEATGLPGVDDDGNGYVDDVHGYDVVDSDGDPMDTYGHGTSVASVIAAAGNNGIGLTGVSWNTKIVAVRVTNGSTITIGDIEAGIDYALTVGAKISNNSYRHFGGYSQSLWNMINLACSANHLFVAAAGNNGEDNDNLPDYLKIYPASYNLYCITAVGMTDRSDSVTTGTRKCSNGTYSGYGATSVDLAAPGCEVCCATRVAANPTNPYYCGSSGTSLSTPIVAGAAALLWEQQPSLSNLLVKDRLLRTVDVVPSAQGRMVSNGRLNIERALDDVPPATVSNISVSTGRWSAAVNWTAPGDDGNVGAASSYELRYATYALNDGNFTQGTIMASGSPGASGTVHCSEVDGLSQCTTYYFAVRTIDDAFNVSGVGSSSGTTKCSGSSVASCGGLRPLSARSTAEAKGFEFSLKDPFPNPGKGRVTIGYSMKEDGPVMIRIYDLAGRLVRTLASGNATVGYHEISWDGSSDVGRDVGVGVYFCRMEAGAWRSERRMLFFER